jgi:two-component system cell cycle response regulator
MPFAVHRGTRQVGVTVSIGVAAREDRDTAPAEVLKRADQALYLAKQRGRNRVVATAA